MQSWLQHITHVCNCENLKVYSKNTSNSKEPKDTVYCLLLTEQIKGQTLRTEKSPTEEQKVVI